LEADIFQKLKLDQIFELLSIPEKDLKRLRIEQVEKNFGVEDDRGLIQI
jgi:hypothetical protein